MLTKKELHEITIRNMQNSITNLEEQNKTLVEALEDIADNSDSWISDYPEEIKDIARQALHASEGKEMCDCVLQDGEWQEDEKCFKCLQCKKKIKE